MMKFRLLLLPFAWLYGCIITIRYALYETGIFKRHVFKVPIVAIGNLSVGGTGKSPLTLYLATLISNRMKTGILSRGYGRKSKGLLIANNNATASKIGDEPMMYYQNFLSNGNVLVAVAEKRVTGVDALIQKGMQALVLDDAYQHLAVKAGLYILLTDYNNLYCNDYLLPAGNLREWRSAAHRAQIIMVTKCPVDISPADKNKITTALKLQQHQHLFFSSIAYAPILNVLNALPALNNHFADLINYDCLLITGIANPQPLIVYCQKHFAQVHTLTFADHYMFNENDLSQGRKIFDNIANSKKLILTTQKDWMRLQQGHLKIVLNDLPVYVQPISMQIDNIETFNQIIHTYVNSTHTNG